MLQYNNEMRLSADELARHPFLTKNVRDFTKIDTKKAQRKIDNKGLNINVKQNQTIWAIFNQEDEQKLLNITGGKDLPAPEGPISEDYIRKVKSEKKIEKKTSKHHSPKLKFQKSNSGSGLYPSLENSFYGQKMHPNVGENYQPPGGMQQIRGGIPPTQGIQLYPIQPLPGMQQNSGMPAYPPGMQQYPGMSPYPPGIQQNSGMPGYPPRMQQYPGMPPYPPGMSYNMNNFPTFNLYPYGRAMYPPSNMANPGYMPNKPGNLPNNIPPSYTPFNNDDSDNIGCNIQ